MTKRFTIIGDATGMFIGSVKAGTAAEALAVARAKGWKPRKAVPTGRKAKAKKPARRRCPLCGNRVDVPRGKLATHASHYNLKCPGSGRPAACRCRPARQHRDCNMCGCTSHRPDYFCGVCLVPGVDGKLIPGTGKYVCPMHR
jgi:hypothetical protein